MIQLERLAFFLLLAVTGLRPLIAESYDSAAVGIAAGLAGTTQPAPATTLAIDGIILISSVLIALARVRDPALFYRWTGLEVGAAVVAVAGVISICFAGNRRLAANATTDWLCLPLLTMSLVQLLHRPWQRRLLLCVVLASAVVQAADCFNQVSYEFPETRADYVARREQFWGPDADPAQVELFERRMSANEAYGFLQHSNVAAAHLLLAGFVGIGLAAGRWRAGGVRYRRGFAVAGGLLAAGMLMALPLTGSLGALSALAAGLFVLVVRRWLGAWIEAHTRRALLIGWALLAGGLGAAIAHGLHHGTLPHPSLAFRWQYWTASAKLIADHPWTGVGRENFGRHYIRYKSIKSSEEVANPHDFLVQGAADSGLPGLIGLIAMLIGGSIVATTGVRARDRGDGVDDSVMPAGGASLSPPSAARREAVGRGVELPARRGLEAAPTVCELAPRTALSPLLWAIGLGAAIFLPRTALLGVNDSAYIVWETVAAGIIWLLAFVIFALESDRYDAFADDELPGLATLINIGLLAFLVQDLINFALFVPGSAITFFAVLAVPISSQPAAAAALKPWPRWLLLAAALGLAVLAAVAIPVARSSAALSAARDTARELSPGGPTEQRAYRAYRLAAERDPLDPTPLAEAAAWLQGASRSVPNAPDYLREALALADLAIQRDPFHAAHYRRRGAIGRDLAELVGRPTDWHECVAAYARAQALYPQSPQALVDLADAESAAASALNDATLRAAAVNHYTAALALDERRPLWETIRRFRPAQRAAIQEKLAAISQPNVP